MRVHARDRHRDRSDNGAAAVEFGLVVIPLLTLVLGMIQYGWYFYVSQSASAAAREVARQVVVGNCWNDLDAFAQGQAWMVQGTTVTPAPSSADIGTMVNVSVTVPEDVVDIVGFVPMPAGPVEKTFTARMEDLEPADAALSPSECAP